MTNCHVAAQMDVFNDVCGNYQYYWYRYSGMMIGTNKNMITDKDGYTVPETSKFHAEGCTVHFGEWNDYYYCELVANSLASYTHDHQFSRLEQISSLEEIKSGDTWTKAGNFLLISGDTKTCYHIVNKDGVLTQHNHEDEGTETVNGETVLKENNQIVYLPFNQLFTGYGWGVKHIPVYNGEDYAFEGITILDREVADSVEKFAKADEAKESYTTGETVAIGELFKEVDNLAVAIDEDNVQVTISPVGEKSTVSGVYSREGKPVDEYLNWKEETLTFSGVGLAQIIITDYNFCKSLTINVEIVAPTEVFAYQFPNVDKYLYRVGNENAVKISSLFKLADGVTEDILGEVSVNVVDVNENELEVYTEDSGDWDSGKIDFADDFEGVVKVTIKDNTYEEPLTLNLEVIDATNATSATSAKDKNIVLLNDCGFSTIEVSNGYTLYGNGFTLTCTNDIKYSSMNNAFVWLKGGMLDNVQIKVPDFSHPVLLNTNISEDGNKSTKDGDNYGNVRSAVIMDGNCKILNSRISGGRAGVYVRNGYQLIENSTIEGGAAANIHVVSPQELTLRDVTLIQEPRQATVHDTSKTVMGFSVLVEAGRDTDPAPINIEGDFYQYAWAHSGYKQYVPEKGKNMVDAIFKDGFEFIHSITYTDGVTRDSLNLGFAYIWIEGGTSGEHPNTIADNRTDKDSVPYDFCLANGIAWIYSYKANSAPNSMATRPAYSSDSQNAISPTLIFNDVNENRVFDTKYYEDKGWMSSLTVDLDAGDYTFDFDNLIAQKYGENLEYTISTSDGSLVEEKEILLADTSIVDYTLKIKDNQIYDENGILTGNIVEHEYPFRLIATKTSIALPEKVAEPSGTVLLVVKNKNDDWSCAIPALEGTQIKYYSKNDKKYKTISLSSLTPASTGKQNGTQNWWEYKESNGEYTLKVTCGYIHDTKQVYGMPVVVNNGGNKMYFTISSTNGYVSTGTAARSVTITYEFTDANGGTLTFSKKWDVNRQNYINDGAKQYSYSEFVNGNLKEASGGCVTPDTLITLADGTKKEIQDLTGEEKLLVWNHESGQLESAAVAYIVNHEKEETEQEIIHLYFSDGSDIKIIGEHVFFDRDLNKYVTLDDNAEDFIGHSFVGISADNSSLTDIKLCDVKKETIKTKAYEVVTYKNITCFTDNILSASAYLDKVLNTFEVQPETMAYDLEKVQEDIEKYGLYTYDDFDELIEKEAFELYNAKYLKVAVGKGYITWEDILDLIGIYYDVEVEPIS